MQNEEAIKKSKKLMFMFTWCNDEHITAQSAELISRVNTQATQLCWYPTAAAIKTQKL